MNQIIKINLNEFDKIRRFIQVAKSFVSDIEVTSGKDSVSGKSILELFNIDLTKEVYAQIDSDNTEELRNFDAAMEEFR